MKASEVAAALLAKVATEGDGEMWNDGGWPIDAIDCIQHEGKNVFFAESSMSHAGSLSAA